MLGEPTRFHDLKDGVRGIGRPAKAIAAVEVADKIGGVVLFRIGPVAEGEDLPQGDAVRPDIRFRTEQPVSQTLQGKPFPRQSLVRIAPEN